MEFRKSKSWWAWCHIYGFISVCTLCKFNIYRFTKAVLTRNFILVFIVNNFCTFKICICLVGLLFCQHILAGSYHYFSFWNRSTRATSRVGKVPVLSKILSSRVCAHVSLLSGECEKRTTQGWLENCRLVQRKCATLCGVLKAPISRLAWHGMKVKTNRGAKHSKVKELKGFLARETGPQSPHSHMCCWLG